MSIRLCRHFILLGLLPGLITCSSGTEPSPTPQPRATAIVLSSPDSVLTRGQVVQFTATLVDSAGAPISGGSYSWSSQYPAIAAVSSDGNTIGVDVGDTKISVASLGLSATAWVQVRDTVIAERLPLFSGPFGLTVHGGTALVTLLESDSMARINLPGLATTGRTSTGHFPTSVVFSPLGTRAYVASQDGLLTVLDPATMTVVDTARYRGSLMGVLASGTDKLWVTVGDRDTIYSLDPASLNILDSAKTPVGPNWIAKDLTRSRLYVNGSGDGRVYELDSETLDSLRAWNLGGMPQGMSVSADGTRLYVANEHNWLDIIALGSGDIAAHVILTNGAFGLALSPDGSRVAMSLGAGLVTVLSTATLATVQTYVTGGTPRRLEYTVDGTHLLIANELGWVDFIR